MTSNSLNSRLFIAVDFGTTHTSVAYFKPDAQTEVEVMKNWEQWSAERIPSILRLKGDGTSSTYGRDAVNGSHSDRKCEWFKLGLDPDRESRRAATSKLHTMLPNNPAHRATRMSLGECRKLVITFLKHVRSAIDNYFRTSMHALQPGYANARRQYTITVPAMWTPRAKDLTRECAAVAFEVNKDKIQVVAEPEAAGIYALGHPMLKPKQGQSFVILDAGGGTVDLSTYQIATFNTGPRGREMELDSLCISDGGLCGSTFLDALFERYVESRLRETARRSARRGWPVEQFEKTLKRCIRAMVAQFEAAVKEGFTGTEKDDHEFWFPADGMVGYGIDEGQVPITAKEIREQVFNPVLDEVEELVKDHLESSKSCEGKIKGVLLAGGFGQNMYLKRRLEGVIKKFDRNIGVLKVPDGKLSIAKGAVLYAYSASGAGALRPPDPSAGSHLIRTITGPMLIRMGQIVATASYGVEAWEVYDEKRHKDAKSRPCKDLSGGWIVKVIDWYIKKGDKFREGVSKSYPDFIIQQSVRDGGEFKTDVIIHTCEEDINDLPLYPDTKDHPEPRLRNAPIVLEMVIDADSAKHLKRGEINGKLMFIVEFELHTQMNSGENHWWLQLGSRKFMPKDVYFKANRS